jgi:hypothetical protein
MIDLKPARTRLGGCAALLALWFAGPAPAEIAPNQLALEKAGWTLVTASEDTWVFMRPAGAPSGDVRRVWTAYDSDSPRQRDGFSFRSVRSLGEYDCRRRLSRVLDEFYHDGAALTGRQWRSPMFRATPWAAAQPNSIGAVRMAYACRTLVET